MVETDSPNEVVPNTKRKSITAMAVGVDDLGESIQGSTIINETTVNSKADDPMHTLKHEVGHFLMLGSESQPITPNQHNDAGGVFKYAVKNINGDIIEPTQGVSKKNVREILKNVPIKKH